MVTKQKNLLQKVRIVFTALLAVLGFGGALAMQSDAGKRVASTYGVYSQTAGHYRVTASPVTASSYECNTAISTICTVQSEMTPQETSPGSGVYQLSKDNASSNATGRFDD